jgi:hypothetical protein
MKKIIITALLLASVDAAQAAMQPCNPATGNWVNAAPTTCRFVSPGTFAKPAVETPEVSIPIREIPQQIPTDEVIPPA